MEPQIIELCILNNGTISYKTSDCSSSFYAINPNFRPIPPGANLFGFLNSLRIITDPHDILDGEVRFIAWVEPVPFTTPLYTYYDINNSVLVSESKLEDVKQTYYSPIYILKDPRDTSNIIKKYKGDERKFRIIGGKPLFRFAGYQGRCLPDPNGTSLSECMLLYVKQIPSNQDSYYVPTMMDYISTQYPNKNTDYTIHIIITIILIVILYILYKTMNKMKNS